MFNFIKRTKDHARNLINAKLSKNYQNRIVQATMLALFGIFFVGYMFLIRYNIEHIKELVTEKLNIVDISTLTAWYYIFYAIPQIPFGIAFDKYGIKKVFTFAATLCSAGLFIFSVTTNFYLALLGRMMLAFGSGAAIPLLAKVNSEIFDSKTRATMMGVLLSAAILGGAMNYPLYTDLIFESSTYENGFFFLSSIGVGMIVVLYLIIYTPKSSEIEQNQINVSEDFKLILKPKSLFYCLCTGIMIATFEGFPDLFGGELLIAHGFSHEIASYIKSYFFCGLALGSLLIPSNFNNRYLTIVYGIGLLICWYFLLYTTPNFQVAFLAYNGLGFFSAYQIIAFYVIEDNMMNKKYGATAVSVANSCIMMFGSLYHKLLPASVAYFSYLGEKEAIICGLQIIPFATLIGLLGFILVKGYNER